jgi:glucokinase-like ROK family protein
MFVKGKILTGSFSLIKKMNTSVILNTIREHNSISRADIARLTKLTPATVTNITSELLQHQIILEAERGESSGGRKPVMLRINTDGYYVVGVYIGSKVVEVVIANLNSDFIFEKKINNSADLTHKDILKNIVEIIQEWRKNNNSEKVLGIGVGVHGLVQTEKGIAVYAPNLGWENVPIKDYFEENLNIPVFIDNDVRTMTLGESWFGVAKDINNFILIYIGYGVGGSIVVDNHLFRGMNEGAGEIGHMTIDPKGPKCSCGNTGCLQTLISENAIVQEMKRLITEGHYSSIKDLVGDEICRISPEIVYEAAINNDNLALTVIKEQSKYLGIAIANLINTINPSMIIISGKITRLGDIVMNVVMDEVRNRSLKYLQHSTKIIYSTLNRKAVLKGAVSLVLNETFSNPDFIFTKV